MAGGEHGQPMQPMAVAVYGQHIASRPQATAKLPYD